jgi:hypothetical protein
MTRALLIGTLAIMAITAGRQLVKSLTVSANRVQVTLTQATNEPQLITSHKWIKD